MDGETLAYKPLRRWVGPVHRPSATGWRPSGLSAGRHGAGPRRLKTARRLFGRLAPEPVGRSRRQGLMVQAWVPGESLDRALAAGAASADTLPTVGRTLAGVHQHQPPPPQARRRRTSGRHRRAARRARCGPGPLGGSPRGTTGVRSPPRGSANASSCTATSPSTRSCSVRTGRSSWTGTAPESARPRSTWPACEPPAWTRRAGTGFSTATARYARSRATWTGTSPRPCWNVPLSPSAPDAVSWLGETGACWPTCSTCCGATGARLLRRYARRRPPRACGCGGPGRARRITCCWT